MDTTQSNTSLSISPQSLALGLGKPGAPLLLDARKAPAFEASSHWLPGALRRDAEPLAAWMQDLPAPAAVVVYCVHGHEVSQQLAAALRQRGIAAQFLEGGLEGWRERSLPLQTKPAGGATCWVTRERPRIDRIACPWLVRRFVDAQARFLYVPTAQVAAVAQRECAVPYDVAPHVAATPYTHVEDFCSFDAFIQRHGLGVDAALCRLADIVRGADTDRLALAPQCAGLVAVSLGMARTHADDHAMLEVMMPVYDALYAWCRDAVAGQDEKHTWKPA
jgi:rhodanese-related sulfurtransferase